MTDSPQQVWVVPEDPNDMAPLPALQDSESRISFYNRHSKQFGLFENQAYFQLFQPVFATFDECRAAMIEARVEQLDQAREHSRKLAASIEHLKTIPTATFPDVLREVPEAQQQEAEGQEEAQAEEVKPSKPTLKQRPSRRV